MSKALQQGLKTVVQMRARSMGSVPPLEKFTPEQIAEMGRRIHPAQTTFGPKDPNIEKWQKFFQDPLNSERPMYRRKGASDDMILITVTVAVLGATVVNLYNLFK